MMDETRSSPNCEVFAPALSGLLDDELIPAERLALLQHLEICSDCARSLERTRAVREELRAVSAALNVPRGLRRRVNAALLDGRQAKPHLPRRRLAVAAGVAAAAVLAVALVSGRFAPAGQGNALVSRVVAAQQSTGGSGAERALATADVIQAARLASSTTQRSIDVPDLSNAGYRFVGIRLEPAVNQHAVAMLYAGDGGQLICVVVPGHNALSGPTPGQVTIHVSEVHGVRVASWWEDDATYLLAGDVSTEALLSTAELALQQ